jgi:GT2 family glycosyltransferase
VFLDDYVIHNALKMFDVNPKLGAIAFNIVDRDGGRGEYSSWGYPISLKSRAAERFLTTTFVGAGHAIRRETWDEVGGYDPKLFFTWEEYDFCLRAIAREWDIIYDGSLHVHHKLALDQRLQWSQGRQRLFVRNRLIIGRKWGASWLSLLPRITGYLITGSLKCCIRATLAGIFEAVSDDKNIAKQSMTQHMRRYLQANEQRYRGISRFMLRTDF